MNGSELRKFTAPEFVFGPGALSLAGRYASNLGARKVLVVTDPGVIAAGWAAPVIESLNDAGLTYALFSDVTPNPRAAEVMAGAQVYQAEGCNTIVAVGGGSPMDCAKGIGAVSSNQQHVLEFEGVDEVALPGPPLICIPTTAGSSADVSQFAIITDTQRRVKIAIVSKLMVPDVALIDPITTTTMDTALTAHTGMDALVHAIEAYVSNAHSPVTDLHALEAIRLIGAHLLPTLAQPDNLELRSRLMLGSLFAGLAFSNASLGAVHALAHSLGGFLDFPHGEGNAILLEHVVAFNYPAAPTRYHHIAQALGLALPPGQEQAALVAGIARLRAAAGIPGHLHTRGLTTDALPTLAQNALRDACMVTNPRRPTLADIEYIYEQTL